MSKESKLKAKVIIDPDVKETMMKSPINKLKRMGKSSLPSGKTSKKGMKALLAKASFKQKESEEASEKARVEAKAKREEKRQNMIQEKVSSGMTEEQAIKVVDGILKNQKKRKKK